MSRRAPPLPSGPTPTTDTDTRMLAPLPTASSQSYRKQQSSLESKLQSASTNSATPQKTQQQATTLSPKHSPPPTVHIRKRAATVLGPKEPGDVVMLIRRRDEDDEGDEGDEGDESDVPDIIARLEACRLDVNVFPLDSIKKSALVAGQEIICTHCCPTGRCCFCCCRCTRVCCESCGTVGTPLETVLQGSCITQHGVATSDIVTAIFVSASLERLNELQRELHDHRLGEQTSVVDHVYVYHTYFSAAERTQLLQRTIEMPVYLGGAGLLASPPNAIPTPEELATTKMAYPTHPAIEVITTLHDPHFIHELFQSHPKYASMTGGGVDGTTPLLYEDASAFVKWKIWLHTFFLGGIIIEHLRPETRDKLTCPEHIHPNEFFVHEIRANYGEETAWFFAFNYHLVRMLYVPAIAGVFLSIFAPIIQSGGNSFFRGLSAALTLSFGVGVAIIWGSIFMIQWARRTAEYNFQWHGHVDGFCEASYPNHDYILEKEEQVHVPRSSQIKHDTRNQVQDESMQRVHRFNSTMESAEEHINFQHKTQRRCAFLWRYLVVGVFGFVWVLLFSHAVAWYVVLRARHTSLAWICLLITKDGIHGIAMAGLGAAIFKGVIGGLMSIENYKTEKERKRVETCTMCSIEWWNFFVGLLILAFVFVPLVDSGLFADSLVRDGSILNLFFKNVMNNEDPSNAKLWPTSFIDQPPPGIYENTTGTGVPSPHVLARNHVQRSLLKENIRLILIGPVVVARILITLVGTVVPFCLQSRRRKELQESLSKNRLKLGGGLRKMFAAPTHLISTGIKRLSSKRMVQSRTKKKSKKAKKSTVKRKTRIAPAFNSMNSPQPEQHSLYNAAMKDPVFFLKLTKSVVAVQTNFRGFSTRRKVSNQKMSLKKADHLVEEAGLVPWNSFLLFNDLNIQITLILFFSSVATWIPFVVLLTNCVEVRLRAMTMVYSSRPPPARSAPGIGTWSKLILMCTWIAVAVNCGMLILPTETLEAVSGCAKKDMHWRLDTNQLSFLMRYVNLGASGNIAGFFAAGSGDPKNNIDNSTWYEVDAFMSEQRRLEEDRLTPCVSSSVRFSFYAGAVGLCAAIKGLLHFSMATVPEWIHIEARRIRMEGKKHF